MKNVYIYCEGQTEESFINNVLYPYFINMNIYVSPIICSTKRTTQRKFKGGVSDYNKIKHELTIICKQHKNEFITSMFDYYAMPANTPGISNGETNIYARIEQIQNSINDDIGQPNLFFGLSLHEFEGLLLSEPSAFKIITTDDIVSKIQSIRDEFETPEHVNNSPETAPSVRLKSLIRDYSKILHGTSIAQATGIDKILDECSHFKKWIEKIRTIE
jgi:hypothetical protein